MKEYVRGAFEALAWTYVLLSNVKDMQQLEQTRNQINQALEKLKTAAAKDFTTDIETEVKTDACSGSQ